MTNATEFSLSELPLDGSLYEELEELGKNCSDDLFKIVMSYNLTHNMSLMTSIYSLCTSNLEEVSIDWLELAPALTIYRYECFYNLASAVKAY